MKQLIILLALLTLLGCGADVKIKTGEYVPVNPEELPAEYSEGQSGELPSMIGTAISANELWVCESVATGRTQFVTRSDLDE